MKTHKRNEKTLRATVVENGSFCFDFCTSREYIFTYVLMLRRAKGRACVDGSGRRKATLVLSVAEVDVEVGWVWGLGLVLVWKKRKLQREI